MTIEVERDRERLGPRIIETEKPGRLELSLPPLPQANLPSPPTARSRLPVAAAVTGIGILVMAVLGIDLVQFIDGAFVHGTVLGVVAAAAVGVGCGGAGYWLVAELRGLLRLHSVERLRRLIPSALSSELKREIGTAAAIVARDPLLGEAVGRYRAVLEPHHSGRDALELFSRFVLAPADQLAEAAIRRAATQAFAINAVSPTGLLDTLLFAGRAMRLIREIAEIYGQRPGVAGTAHLLRRLIGGAGLVGTVDLIGGILVQQLGGAVIERLGAGAAESAYAAQKMARLGILAMTQCRPVDFEPGQIPSLRRLVSGPFKLSS
jgi:putative membrane protein